MSVRFARERLYAGNPSFDNSPTRPLFAAVLTEIGDSCRRARDSSTGCRSVGFARRLVLTQPSDRRVRAQKPASSPIRPSHGAVNA
jgi:hypothetical protein